MIQSLVHRPVHQQGTYANPQLGLSCGWVSHQGATGECIPLWNETRDICLIFSGEDFTDPSEIAELKAKGHRFDADSASYLVHLYEEFGPAFFDKLNGSFAGLLVDLRQQKIVLFNDRYALNRIYFHEDETGLYFASEAKALLKAFPALRQLDVKGLGEFFSCGCVLQNRTLFRGISLLPGGSAWNLSPDQALRKASYFNPEKWVEQPPLGPREYYEEFREIWKRILPRYFRGNSNVALSLTGGVDSRMILAWAPRPSGALPCYTFGGPYRDCKDVLISRQIAGICGQKHDVINVGPDFLSNFPALAEEAVYLSDGAMDVLGAIDLYVQKRASEIAPVRVTGTNGGEILRGLIAFKPNALDTSTLSPELTEAVSSSIQTYATELGAGGPSFTAFKQAPWFMTSKFVVERAALLLRMPYFDNELVRHVHRAPLESKQSNDLSLQLIAEGNPALQGIGTDRGLGPSAIPGLTRARNLFEEFTFRAEYAYDYGMPQWLAKIDHALAPLHLERLFLGRHKFHHFRVFYRDQLSAFVKDVLLDSRARSRPYLEAKAVESLVQGHTSGNCNYTLELHKLLAIELIQRKLIEQN